MRKLLTFWIALAIVGISASSFGGSMMLLGVGKPNVAAGVALSVNASNFTCNGGVAAASGTISLTTTAPNTVIILEVESNSTLAEAATISDTAGLTWPAARTNSSDHKIAEFYAISSGVLTGDVITVNFGGSTFYDLGVMAIAGANTSSPFDPNVSLPTNLSSGVPTVTTTNANTVIYALERVNTSTPTAGSGFTQVSGSNSGCFSIVQYELVSSPQTATSIPLTTGAGNELETIADAVTK
jgi:hypothetical protein